MGGGKIFVGRNIKKVLIIIFVVTFFLEFKFQDLPISPIYGYWHNVDQYIELPMSYHLSGEGIFERDFVVSEFSKLYPTILFSILGNFYSITNNMFFNYIIILLFLKAIYVFFSYKLSKLLLKKEYLAIVATIFLSFSHFMGPDEVGVIEIVPKAVVFAFIPMLLYLFLKDEKKYCVPVFVFLGLLTYIHSTSVVPIALILFFSLLVLKKDYKNFLLCLATFSIIFLPYFWSNFIERSSPDYSDFTYIAQWYLLPNAARTVAKYFIVFLLGLWTIKRYNKEVFYLCLILILYSSITLFSPWSDTIRILAFFRAMKFVLFFSFIFLPILISDVYKNNKLLSVLILLILFIPFSSIYYSNLFVGLTAPKSLYLQETHNVIGLGNWLQNNTPKDVLIMVPPDWSSIRVWSLRSIVISDVDAHVSSWSKEISAPIRQRFNDVKIVYNNSSVSGIINISSKYKVDYIVTYNISLGVPEVYSIGSFKIYNISRLSI